MNIRVFLLCLLFVSPVYADYYLKFETSGAALPDNTALNASNDAWLKVSIIDTYPTDGPVHYEGSETGAWPMYKHATYYTKTVGVNYLNFYYADVPRSLTLIDKTTGGKTVISVGDQPHPITGAPAVLLPDSTMVAPGVAVNDTSYSIYIVAARPVKLMTDRYDLDPSAPDLTNYITNHNRCLQGWMPSSVDAEGVNIVQCVNNTTSDSLMTTFHYSGFLTHVVRLQ